MSERPARARCLLAASAVAVIAHATASTAPVTALLALLLGAVAVVLTTSRVGLVVPRWLSGVVTVGVLAWTAQRALADGLGVHDFAEFVTWMMVVKAFDRRTANDDAQLLALSVFLCVASMLLSNGLAIATLTLAYMPCLAYGAMQLQLRLGHERAMRLARRGLAPQAVAPVVRAAAGPAASRRLTQSSVVALGLGCVFAVLVFVVVPRGAGLQQIGRWGNPSVGRVVGFSDRVRVGMGGVISVSHRVVLHLKLTDSRGLPLGGLGAVKYLRGAVLDEYEDGVWRPLHEPSEEHQAEEAEPLTTVPIGGTGGESMVFEHVTLLNTPRDYVYLPMLWRPTEVRCVDPFAYVLDRRTGTMMVAGAGGKLRYVARSSINEAQFLRRDQRDPTHWDSPVVASVAASILAEHTIDPEPARRSISDDSLAINAFRQYFWSHYRYSLSSAPAPPGQDPIDWFLTEGTEGHCEYYAAALAALCRSVGIPARVVTGYVAAEYNSATGHYVVRESNAHAWVEAQAEPGIWKTYDATPPADLLKQHGPAPGVLARAAQLLDAINYTWINSVVSFDSTARDDLLGWSEPATKALSRNVERLLERVRAVPASFGVPLGIRVGLLAAGVALVVLLLFEAVARWRRSLARRPAALVRRIEDGEIRARLLKHPLYQELLTLFARAGERKPTWQPPMAWAGGLGPPGWSVRAGARRLTELFYAMRFGGRDLTAQEQAEAGELLRALTEAVRAREAGAGEFSDRAHAGRDESTAAPRPDGP